MRKQPPFLPLRCPGFGIQLVNTVGRRVTSTFRLFHLNPHSLISLSVILAALATITISLWCHHHFQQCTLEMASYRMHNHANRIAAHLKTAPQPSPDTQAFTTADRPRHPSFQHEDSLLSMHLSSLNHTVPGPLFFMDPDRNIYQAEQKKNTQCQVSPHATQPYDLLTIECRPAPGNTSTEDLTAVAVPLFPAPSGWAILVSQASREILEPVHNNRRQLIILNVLFLSFLLILFLYARHADGLDKQQKHLLRQLIDHLPHSIFVKDRHGQFIVVNRVTADLVGLTVEEMTGTRQKKSSRNADLIERWHNEDKKVIQTGKPLTIPEEIVVDAQGRMHVMHTAKIPFKYSDASEPGVLGISVDITKIKEAEEENLLLEKQLLQAQKMETIGTLVSGVAHEVNNPNNFIILNIPILEQLFMAAMKQLDERFNLEGDFFIGKMQYSKIRQKVPRLFAGITYGANRVKQIIAELKNFAGQDPHPQTQPVDILQVVRSAAALLDNLIKKTTTGLVIHAPDTLPSVNGNFQRIEQVIVNLLQNSCHAQKSRDTPIEISIRGISDISMLRIVLQDYGIGMTENTLLQIKKPFFTTKRTSGGTGLGLSVSNRIIREHGGSMQFRSSPDNGTAVTIWLPYGSSEEHL